MDKKGFSLIEILVTLTILGFTIAMATPRFAGMTAQATDTAGRMNAARLIKYITSFWQDHGSYPAGLINLVSTDNVSGQFLKPRVSDQDPDNGMGVLSHASDRRCRFRIHYLNAAEAAELRDLGIVFVYNLNSKYDTNVANPSPLMEKVGAGTAVLMIGGGDANNNGVIETGEVDVGEAGWGENDLHFCMVFGLGPESDLIKKGYIVNASICPHGANEPRNFDFAWYSLVLPRLAATSRRLGTDDPLGADTFTSFAMENASGTDAAGLSLAKVRETHLYQAQDPSFFTVINSSGEKFQPSSGSRFWGIDFDADGDIGI
ncbi:MAG: type II secretion system GspH family protein [Desulfobacterales bacterium]|nr:type II secretion system GspH family protein [Desulfobacterales bacterium]